ncbi:uncharacterized protein [Macrobrachium rosenbergii]|uniref:uncharacterized protein isoform X1 n=1 Tax=Macrobrachium rosenbergii TaxID=79674 RepID=UPI0034D64A01
MSLPMMKTVITQRSLRTLILFVAIGAGITLLLSSSDQSTNNRFGIFSSESSQGETGGNASARCSSHDHIMFLKTHKCASSTVQNIFLRYGFKHNLTFALPEIGNYLGNPRLFTANLVPRRPSASEWQSRHFRSPHETERSGAFQDPARRLDMGHDRQGPLDSVRKSLQLFPHGGDHRDRTIPVQHPVYKEAGISSEIRGEIRQEPDALRLRLPRQHVCPGAQSRHRLSRQTLRSRDGFRIHGRVSGPPETPPLLVSARRRLLHQERPKGRGQTDSPPGGPKRPEGVEQRRRHPLRPLPG